MPAIRNFIRQLQFASFQLFARYIAILFVHVSNIIHNTPPDVIIIKEWPIVNKICEKKEKLKNPRQRVSNAILI